ncbi:MAG: outer membrane lipase/esterase [Arenicella sp.]|jgi:outer membrane lipase/esterase
MRKHYLSGLIGVFCLSFLASQANADVDIVSSGQSVICEFRDDSFGQGSPGPCPSGTDQVFYNSFDGESTDYFVGCMSTVTASQRVTEFESCSVVDDLDSEALIVVLESPEYASFESLCSSTNLGEDYTNQGVTTEIPSGVQASSPSNSCSDVIVISDEPTGRPFPEAISDESCPFVMGNGTTGDFGLVSENDGSATCEVGLQLEATSGETMRTVQRFLRKATEACDSSGGDVTDSLFTDNVFPGTDKVGYGAFLRCQVQKSTIGGGVFSDYIDGPVIRACDSSCTQEVEQTRECIGGEVGQGACVGELSRVVEKSCSAGQGMCPINAATRGTIQDNVLIEPNSSEASAAIAIENLCPQLGFGDRSLTSGQQDLLARCQNLIAETNDPRQFKALQNIIADEISAQAVNLRRLNLAFLSDITSRLAAMRPALVRSSEALSSNGKLSHPLPGYAGVSRAELLYQQEQSQMPGGFSHLERGGAAGDEELPDIGRWGIFVNGLFGTGDRTRTRNASSFDFDSYNVTVGADYLLDATSIVGLAIGYGGSDTDFSDNGGSLENDTQSLSLYTTHYFNNLWFVDAVLGYGSSDYINRRNLDYIAEGVTVTQTTEGRPDGDQMLFSVGVGRTLTTSSAIDWDFSLRLNYLDASIDRFAERTLSQTAAGFGLALEIEKQDITSTTAELGLSVSKAFSQNFGVIVPSFGLSWSNEFEDGSEFLTARFIEDPFSFDFVQSGIGGSAGALPTIFQVALDPNDSSYGRAQLGVNVLLPNSWSFNFVVNKTLGLEAIDFEYYSLGMRKSF